MNPSIFCSISIMTPASFIFIIVIFLLPFDVFAQNNGTVAVGSTLTANATSSSWLSPSGDFAFGFKETEDKDLFILAIWYDKLPTKTIVWFNNTFDPVPQGSTVALNQTGLVLRNPQGRTVWSTEHVAAAGDVDHGFMNDTGNFILMKSDNISLWESFQFPADTLLPFQDLPPGSELISRRSDTNFSEGKFHLRFLDNGNLVLTTRSVPTNIEEEDYVYYESQTSDDVNNGSASGVRVVFEESGSLNILRRNNQTKDLNQLRRPIPPASENYFRATLNFDGVFTFYYHPRSFSGMTNWEAVWWEPDDICSAITITDQKRGNGACGYNNVCSLGDSGRPICECPDGYELVNPNDSYGSCRGNFTESCGDTEQAASGQDFFDFKVVRSTNWPFFDYQRIWPSNETACRNACLQDCFCAVAVFGGDSCWKKKLPLSNGRKGDAYSGNIVFLKYRIRDVTKDQEPEPKSKPKESRTSLIVVSVLLGGSFLINFMFITASCCGVPFIYGKRRSKFHQTNNIVEKSFHCFTYKELVEATNGFKEEIGRGSFGIVYKGVIQTGSRSTVAVKKLDRVLQDAEKEFRAEVNAIGQTHHKNLVRLLGFCDEGKHRLLVYEYMTNGTLSSFLFNTTKQSWSLRTQIAIGIARGLTYLHEECTSQIIHCDIKPQNILLDDYYNTRISDFGLAKLLVLNQSRTLTNIRGTKGYVAPEWFRNKQITSKVDVYSFGVLLLEIITCRRCLGDPENEEENPILTDWVWDCFQEGRLDTLVENDLEALNDWKMLKRFVQVGIWCIQEDSSLRPTMRKVSQMLEGVVEVITPPCPFPFASNA